MLDDKDEQRIREIVREEIAAMSSKVVDGASRLGELFEPINQLKKEVRAARKDHQ